MRAASGAFCFEGRITVIAGSPVQKSPVRAMKIKNSLKSLKSRHRMNRLVRRRGRVYIINKSAPRFKARQG